MKVSRYNCTFPLENGQIVLYNTLTDGILVLLPELHAVYQENQEEPERLERIHPEFFAALRRKDFLVDEGTDEYALALEQVRKEEADEGVIQITVNPTLDCNFRCWYCYEEHRSGSKMPPAVQEACKKFLYKTFHREDIRRVVLSFFGGEPMLYYREIVLPLIRHARQCSQETGKGLDLYMTTNGYLLTEKVFDELSAMGAMIDFQIPLDGDEAQHDKTKFLKDKRGTYAIVRQNILYGAKKGFPLTLRCNYTAENIASFLQVAEDFKEISRLPNVEAAFHKIWQEKPNPELHREYLETKAAFARYGYRSGDVEGRKGLCYADKLNNLTINYDGKLYCCTAREFDEKYEGILTAEGDAVWNERHEKRRSCKYHSAACRACIFFPICMQTCSQNVLESPDPDSCVAGRTPQSIERAIKTRICLISPYPLDIGG